MNLPGPWRVQRGRDPDAELRDLQRRFRNIRERHDDMESGRGSLIGMSLAVLLGIGIGGVYLAVEALSPWPVTTMLKHLAAAEGCSMARSLGLTPARRGEPGYWAHHDGDKNGIACERWRTDDFPRR